VTPDQHRAGVASLIVSVVFYASGASLASGSANSIRSYGTRRTPISCSTRRRTSCSPFISATGTAFTRSASARAPELKSLVVMMSPWSWVPRLPRTC
jgi:hypothetical protein